MVRSKPNNVCFLDTNRKLPLPGVLKQTPLGTLHIDTSGIVHKDRFAIISAFVDVGLKSRAVCSVSYPKLWTKYPRLRLYNEDYRINDADFDEVSFHTEKTQHSNSPIRD